MSGKTFFGNSTNLAQIPDDIFIGDEEGKARLVDSIYVGDSNGIARKVWPISILPIAYQQIEFIRNSNQGTYISLDLPKLDNFTTLYFDFAIHSYRENIYIPYSEITGNHSPLCYLEIKYGIHGGNSDTRSYGITLPSSGSIMMVAPSTMNYVGDEETGVWYYRNIVGQVNYVNDERHNIIMNLPWGYFLYDGEIVGSSDETYSFVHGDTITSYDYLPNIALFGYITYLSRYYGGSSVNLYRFSAWQNNTLIRDLVPCIRKSDTVIGMFDTVNNKFYPPSGSGTFYPGPNV